MMKTKRSKPSQEKLPTSHAQRGFVAVLLLVMMAMAAVTALTVNLWGKDSKTAERRSTRQALQQAKEALLADLIVGNTTVPGSSDILLGYTALLNSEEGHLRCPNLSGDGVATGTCGTGAGLPSSGIHSLGLFPWRSLGIPKLQDGTNECLWYAVSGYHKSGVVATGSRFSPINADTGAPFSIIQPVKNIDPLTGIAVWSERLLAGNTANPQALDPERVVAVIIAPGSARTTQDRTPGVGAIGQPCPLPLLAAGVLDAPTSATRYLESYLSSTGAILSNRAIQPSTNGAKIFVQADVDHEKLNDELIWITAEEFANAASKRALKILTMAINNYVYGYYLSDPVQPPRPPTVVVPSAYIAGAGMYPPAATTPGGACVAGRTRGYVPFSCALGPAATAYAIGASLGALGAGDNWGEQAHYAVTPNCLAVNGLAITMPPFNALNPPSTVCTPGGVRMTVDAEIGSIHALILMRGKPKPSQSPCAGLLMHNCIDDPVNAANVAAGNAAVLALPGAAPPLYHSVPAGSNDLLHLFRQRTQ